MINIDELKFDEKGLIPAIVQDYTDNEVLMMAYMNKESLQKTLDGGRACYFSRSRNELWLKGDTSGHFQNVKEIYYDCDSDTLLLKVEQIGDKACHTGKRSCFHNKLKEFDKVSKPDIFDRLYDTMIDRKTNPVAGSYTNYLFEKGLDKILKKIGEESAEVIIAAKGGNKEEVIGESSDLIYHTLVMLANEGIEFREIKEELEKRQGKKHEKDYTIKK